MTLAGPGWFGFSVAVDKTSVYWTNTNVMRVPLSGGAVEELWKGGMVSASDIAVSDTAIYWTTDSEYPVNSSVMKLPVGGTSPVEFVPCYKATGIALGTTHVYWLEGSVSSALKRVPLAGGDSETLASGLSASPFVVGSTNVYLVQSGSIMSLPLSGGTLTTLAQGQGVAPGLAVDATSAYWSDMTTGFTNGRIMKVPLTGGTGPIQIATAENPGNLAVDSTSLYWVPNFGSTAPGQTGSVQKVQLTGGTPETLVTGQQPTSIAVDATSVYWTNANGTVMKLTPK